MKYYNNNTQKVEDLPRTVLLGKFRKYTNKLTDEELIKAGYFRIKDTTNIDTYFYKPGKISYKIVDGRAIKIVEQVELPLDVIKNKFKKDIKKQYLQNNRFKVDSTLGYYVDCSKEDLENLQLIKDLNLDTIKTADNTFETLQDGDIDIILNIVKKALVNKIHNKWDKESKVNNCKSINELQNIKNTILN